MFVSMSQALAVQEEIVPYYSAETDSTIVSASVSAENEVEFVLKEKDQPDYFYWIFLSEEDSGYKFSEQGYSVSVWRDICDIALTKICEEDKVLLTDVVAFSEYVPYGFSAEMERLARDFFEYLYGNEYGNKLIATTNTKPIRRVTEDLEYTVNYAKRITVQQAMGYASFITGVLGLGLSNTALGVLSAVTGAISYIPAETIYETYDCTAKYTRFGWCDLKKYVVCGHHITYMGILGPAGLDIFVDPIADFEDIKFSVPDAIMDDAYAYWRAENL